MTAKVKSKRDKAREAAEEYKRFLETAKAVEASEAPEAFDRAFGKVAKPQSSSRRRAGAKPKPGG